MTAPVGSAPSVRASRPSGADGDSTGGAPFASALDGALSAGRHSDVAAVGRRSPQAEQRPDRGEHRALGHDRADGPAAGRAADRDRTRATPADDAGTDPDPADAVAAAVSGGVPPAWALPTTPPLATADATDPVGTSAAVDAVAGPPAPTTGPVPAAMPTTVPDLPVPGLPDDDAAALPAAGPDPAAAPPPSVLPGAPGTPVLPDAAVRGMAPGAPGAAVVTAAGRPPTPSSAAPVPVPAAAAGGDSPAPPVVPPPLLPVPPPPWARAATGTGPASTAVAPAVPATADSPSALPAADAAPALATDSSSSDAGDTSQQNPGASVADPAAAVVASPTVAPAAPVAPVAATTATAVATGPAAPPPVATQVAAQIVTLSQGPDATHSVTLVLHPENLGPVHVQMTLAQGAVDLTLRGAHEQGRAALLDSLPDLRRDLEAAGLSCSSLGVDRDTGGSWSSRQQSANQQAAAQQWGDQSRRRPDWSDGRVRPWSRTADSGDSRQIPAPSRSTSRGVDFRV